MKYYEYDSDPSVGEGMASEIYWLENYLYSDRHNVLFNLYGFDGFRSDRNHAPELHLIDCDFTYFFDM